MRFRLQPPSDELAAERERALAEIRRVVPHAEVEEVGSTAVPGVIGKQDIDVLVRVPEDAFVATREALDRAFERNAEQLSNAQYQGYRVPSRLDVAIQLTIAGGPYDDFLAFRDALRADPELVREYNALKQRWDGGDMGEYRRAKSELIARVLSTIGR